MRLDAFEVRHTSRETWDGCQSRRLHAGFTMLRHTQICTLACSLISAGRVAQTTLSRENYRGCHSVSFSRRLD